MNYILAGSRFSLFAANLVDRPDMLGVGFELLAGRRKSSSSLVTSPLSAASPNASPSLCYGSRVKRSRSQANGSTPFALALLTSEYIKAALSPPPWLLVFPPRIEPA